MYNQQYASVWVFDLFLSTHAIESHD